jgi:hypothetical protein
VDWPGLVRRYIWDEEKTPYRVPSHRLGAGQIRSELFAYGLLLSTLGSLATVIALLTPPAAGPLASPLVGLYGATLAGAAVRVGLSGHPGAAGYCLTAPLLTGLGAGLGWLRPGMGGLEGLAVAAASVLWLGYAARVVRIARRLHGRD